MDRLPPQVKEKQWKKKRPLPEVVVGVGKDGQRSACSFTGEDRSHRWGLRSGGRAQGSEKGWRSTKQPR